MPREERDSTIDDFRRDAQNTYSVWVVDDSLHLILSRLTMSLSPQILGCSRLLSPKDSGMRTQITILRHTCRST